MTKAEAGFLGDLSCDLRRYAIRTRSKHFWKVVGPNKTWVIGTPYRNNKTVANVMSLIIASGVTGVGLYARGKFLWGSYRAVSVR